jgi:hypothetical protein
MLMHSRSPSRPFIRSAERTKKIPAAIGEQAQTLMQQMEQTSCNFEKVMAPGGVLVIKYMELVIARGRTIITIGYGSFFAIWALAKTHMEAGEVLLTALLMLLSVLLYIGNELYNALLFRKITDIMPSIEAADPAAINAWFDALKKWAEKSQWILARVNYLRPSIMWGALVFAVMAVAVMLWALLSCLLNDYAPHGMVWPWAF